MSMKNTGQLKLDIVLGYVYVVLCLLCTAIMYNYIVPVHLNTSVTRLLLAVMCIAVVFVNRRVSTKAVAFILTLSIYLIIYIVFTRINTKDFIVAFFVPLLTINIYCIEIVKNETEKNVINAFINVMTIISAISLFFWIFGTLLELIPPTKTLPYVRGNILLQSTTYYYIYFSNKVQRLGLFGFNTIRNVGVFCEAPSFTSPLLYALGAELFYNKSNTNRIKVCILIATIISTLSSKGFIGLILIIVINYLFFRKAKSRNHAIIKIFLSIIALAAGSYFISLILIEKSNYVTGIDRYQDLQAAMRAFASSPIFGVGYANFEKVHSYGSSSLKGMSMGIPTFMAYGGIYLFAPFITPILVIIRRKDFKHRREILSFALVVIFDFFVSLMHSNPCLFTVLGLSYGTILKNTRFRIVHFQSNRSHSVGLYRNYGIDIKTEREA